MTATATYIRNPHGKNYWLVEYEDGTTFRDFHSCKRLKAELAEVGVTLI